MDPFLHDNENTEEMIAHMLSAFECDERHENGKYTILALKNKAETSAIVPPCVEIIADSAFEGSSVMKVELPEGLMKIGDRAFADCKDLAKIRFPQSLLIIGREAFAGCTYLDTFLPNGVRVGENAFSGTELERRKERLEAAGVDEQIISLASEPKNLEWCNKVARLENQLNQRSESFLGMCQEIAMLEGFRAVIEDIREAAKIDESIRSLAQNLERGEEWCNSVTALDGQIPGHLRKYLSEKEQLARITVDAQDLFNSIVSREKVRALQINEHIEQLANDERNLNWCERVEALKSDIDSLPDRVRSAVKLSDLNQLLPEIKPIRDADALDRTLRRLNQSYKNIEWCDSVNALYEQASRMDKHYLKQPDLLDELYQTATQIRAEIIEAERISDEEAKLSGKKEKSRNKPTRSRTNYSTIWETFLRILSAILKVFCAIFSWISQVLESSSKIIFGIIIVLIVIFLCLGTQWSLIVAICLSLLSIVLLIRWCWKEDLGFLGFAIVCIPVLLVLVLCYFVFSGYGVQDSDADSGTLGDTRSDTAEVTESTVEQDSYISNDTLGEDQSDTAETSENTVEQDFLIYNGTLSKCYVQSETVNVPDGVTAISYHAFSECQAVHVNLPDSVTTIDSHAFSQCYTLESIQFGSSLTTIGAWAFQDCTSLKSIRLSDSVTEIGDGAFSGCTSLDTIEMGNAVMTVGSWAFQDCTSLKSIRLSDSVTEIGDGAFSGCTALETIEMGDAIVAVGDYAFSDCTSLKSISLSDSVTGIGDSAFSGCTALDTIEMGNAVMTIGESAFSRCASLKSIRLTDSVTVIGDNAFWNCSALEEIEIGDAVMTIGEWAFFNCTSLKSIRLSDSVTVIGDAAFQRCSSLNEIYVGSNVNRIDSNAFSGSSNLKIYYDGTEEQWEKIEKLTDENGYTWDTGAFNYEIIFLE